MTFPFIVKLFVFSFIDLYFNFVPSSLERAIFFFDRSILHIVQSNLVILILTREYRLLQFKFVCDSRWVHGHDSNIKFFLVSFI